MNTAETELQQELVESSDDLKVEIALVLIDPDSVKKVNQFSIAKYDFTQYSFKKHIYIIWDKDASEMNQKAKSLAFCEVYANNQKTIPTDGNGNAVFDIENLSEEMLKEYKTILFRIQRELLAEKGIECEEVVDYHVSSEFTGKVDYKKASRHSSLDIRKILKGISRFCRWDTLSSASVESDIIENVVADNTDEIVKEVKIKQFIRQFYMLNPVDNAEEFAKELYAKTHPNLFSDTVLNKKISMLRLRFNVYFRLLSMLITHLPIRLIDSKVSLGVEIENVDDINDWNSVSYEDLKFKFIPIVEQRASVCSTQISMDRRFVSNNTEGRLGFVIMHEVLHVALMHLFRHSTHPVYESLRSLITYYNNHVSSMYLSSLTDEEQKKEKKSLEVIGELIDKLRSYQNIAMDNPINITCYAEQERLKGRNSAIQPLLVDCPNEESGEWIYCKDLDGLISEEIYELMEERQPPASYSFDSHTAVLQDGSGNENERRMWENRIRKAILESGHGTSSVGSPAVTLLEKALKYASRINYKERLREAVVNENAAEISWRKPNRRYLALDMYMPSNAGNRLEIVVLADTSGSMGGYLEVVANEIIAIAESFQNYDIHFYAVDTDICYYEKVTSEDETTLDFDRISNMMQGGGGTCFLSFFKHVEENHHGKLVVGLSDMYATFPKSYGREPLWLVPEEYQHVIEELQETNGSGYSNYAILYNEHLNQ